MNVFLLSFDTDVVARGDVVDAVNATPSVVNWYAFFPGSLALVSNENSHAVSRAIRKHLPDAPFFMTRIDARERSGLLPRSVWAFIDDPSSVEAEVS